MGIFDRISNEIGKHGGIKGTIMLAKRIYTENGVAGVKYIIQKKQREVFQAGMKEGSGIDYEYQYSLQYDTQYNRKAGNEYIQRRSENINVNREKDNVKLIAYYLPQYHPFKENDEWWGKGFTEWRNVAKSVPLFVGQHQPKLPADLGFYDLRVKETQLEQIKIAKQYGIYGFCYYYYWFSGKKLMELPLNTVLNNKELDLPFCICWANENWTRNWDGNQQNILIRQEYNDADPAKFIEDILPIIKDDRYIRVNGKPMILVYTIYDIPNVKNVTEQWRTCAENNGLSGLHLVAVKRMKEFEYKKYGFDALVEFPPHGLDWVPVKEKPVRLAPRFDGGLWDYREFVKQAKQNVTREHDPEQIHSVMPSWDNTARRPDGKANVFMKSSPMEYKKWLQVICEHTDKLHEDSNKFVFINAWNEWAESACLEPDNKYGYANLEATAETLEEISNMHYAENNPRNFNTVVKRESDIAVILHLFYGELWNDINGCLHNIKEPFDLYISVPTYFSQNIMDNIKEEYPNVHFTFVENKGRDIIPFLQILKEISELGYKCVCKIHSKKSSHLDNKDGWKKGVTGDEWRNEIYAGLLGSKETTDYVIKAFKADDKLGVWGPSDNYMQYKDAVGGNRTNVNKLSERFGLNKSDEFSFFAGSMFWFKPEALKGLWNIPKTDFEEEQGQIDGTMAHAVERIICKYAESLGYKVEIK